MDESKKRKRDENSQTVAPQQVTRSLSAFAGTLPVRRKPEPMVNAGTREDASSQEKATSSPALGGSRPRLGERTRSFTPAVAELDGKPVGEHRPVSATPSVRGEDRTDSQSSSFIPDAQPRSSIAYGDPVGSLGASPEGASPASVRAPRAASPAHSDADAAEQAAPVRSTGKRDWQTYAETDVSMPDASAQVAKRPRLGDAIASPNSAQPAFEGGAASSMQPSVVRLGGTSVANSNPVSVAPSPRSQNGIGGEKFSPMSGAQPRSDIDHSDLPSLASGRSPRAASVASSSAEGAEQAAAQPSANKRDWQAYATNDASMREAPVSGPAEGAKRPRLGDAARSVAGSEKSSDYGTEFNWSEAEKEMNAKNAEMEALKGKAVAKGHEIYKDSVWSDGTVEKIGAIADAYQSGSIEGIEKAIKAAQEPAMDPVKRLEKWRQDPEIPRGIEERGSRGHTY